MWLLLYTVAAIAYNASVHIILIHVCTVVLCMSGTLSVRDLHINVHVHVSRFMISYFTAIYQRVQRSSSELTLLHLEY